MNHVDGVKILKVLYSCETLEQLFAFEQWAFRLVKGKEQRKFLIIRMSQKMKAIGA